MTLTPHVILAELLRKGTTTERELYESVKKIVESMGGEVTKSEFTKLLMTLELRGYLRIEGSRRIVQLAPKKLEQQG
jgi:heme oxygenase